MGAMIPLLYVMFVPGVISILAFRMEQKVPWCGVRCFIFVRTTFRWYSFVLGRSAITCCVPCSGWGILYFYVFSCFSEALQPSIHDGARRHEICPPFCISFQEILARVFLCVFLAFQLLSKSKEKNYLLPHVKLTLMLILLLSAFKFLFISP
jgi:L-asparagine transporter-like permease